MFLREICEPDNYWRILNQWNTYSFWAAAWNCRSRSMKTVLVLFDNRWTKLDRTEQKKNWQSSSFRFENFSWLPIVLKSSLLGDDASKDWVRRERNTYASYRIFFREESNGEISFLRTNTNRYSFRNKLMWRLRPSLKNKNIVHFYFAENFR